MYRPVHAALPNLLTHIRLARYPSNRLLRLPFTPLNFLLERQDEVPQRLVLLDLQRHHATVELTVDLGFLALAIQLGVGPERGVEAAMDVLKLVKGALVLDRGREVSCQSV